MESRSRSSSIAPTLYGIAVLAFRASLVAVALASAYLLYGLFSGLLTNYPQLPQPDRVRIIGNIGLSSQVLLYSVAVAAFMCAYAYWREEVTGYLLALAGALLSFGLPYLFYLVSGSGGEGAVNVAIRRSVSAFPDASWPLLGVGALLIARDVILRLFDAVQNKPLVRGDLRYGGEAQPETAKPIRLSPLGKCWEGPFCREFIRTRCPIYLKRQACWRQRRGCYCEEEIVSGASSKVTGVELNMAPDPRYNFANAPVVARRAGLTPAQKAERCRHCVIYNEHQRAKYQLALPITILLVGGLCFLAAPLLQGYLRAGLGIAETMMNRFSFGDSSQGVSFRFGRPSPTVEWIFIGAFMVMVLSKALQALEWAIFKIKI